MRVLISGASIAGPVLAFWLAHYGFEVTVIERSPAPRKSGGHAVDLFKPAMDIIEMMGVLDHVEAHSAGTEVLSIHRAGKRPIDLPEMLIFSAVSERHVEIMRDDLSEILYGASAPGAEYIFGDSITDLADDGAMCESASTGPQINDSTSSSAPTDCTHMFVTWYSARNRGIRIGWASISRSPPYPTIWT